MFFKIAFFNYYLRKMRDLRKDGKASIQFNDLMQACISYKHILANTHFGKHTYKPVDYPFLERSQATEIRSF
jgi:hypothetical protein